METESSEKMMEKLELECPKISKRSIFKYFCITYLCGACRIRRISYPVLLFYKLSLSLLPLFTSLRPFLHQPLQISPFLSSTLLPLYSSISLYLPPTSSPHSSSKGEVRKPEASDWDRGMASEGPLSHAGPTEHGALCRPQQPHQATGTIPPVDGPHHG